MRFDIDSGKLLYTLGVVFGAAALLYFVRDVVFGLSIPVKTTLLFLAFAVLFLLGLTTDRDVLDVVAFTLSGVSYVVFVAYVVFRYEPGDTGTFLLLAFSAGLFVALGYFVRTETVAVPGRTARLVVVTVVLFGTVLVGVDAVGGGVSYALDTESSVTVEPLDTDEPIPYRQTEHTIGTMTATNEFVFTRVLDLPRLSGCLVGVDRARTDVWVSYEFSAVDDPDIIAGGTTRRFSVVASLTVEDNTTESVTYTIERGSDCTVERDSPTLLVSVGSEPRRD